MTGDNHSEKVCPNCYQEFTVDECADCGTPLVSPGELQVEAAVIVCKGCGERLEEGVKGCPGCAADSTFLGLPATLLPGLVCIAIIVAGVPLAVVWLPPEIGLIEAVLLPVLGGIAVFYSLDRSQYRWVSKTVRWNTLTPEQRDVVRTERAAELESEKDATASKQT